MPSETVRKVLERHAHELTALPGVVGIAEGEADDAPCVTVYVTEKTADVLCGIPADLEGWPVIVRESGEFRGLAG